jgi:hypothetical protein
MTFYEHTRRQALRTIADVDAEIDLLKLRWQMTVDPATRRDCEDKLAICRRIRTDLQQLELFAAA